MEAHTRDRPAVLPYADAARVIAVLAVIALHASAARVVHLPDVHSAAWSTANAVDSFSRWAVPLFVMLSGALNLDPHRQHSLRTFYARRSMRVVIPLLFWVPVYFLWTAYFYWMDVSWAFIRSSLWDGLTYNHLYFLFIIAGLYVITPAIRALLRRLPEIALWPICVALIVVTSEGWFFRHVEMNAVTRFTPYVMYYLAGHLLGNREWPAHAGLLFLAAYVAASAVITVQTNELVAQLGREDWQAFQYYDHFNVFVILQTTCVFVLIQSLFRSTSPSVSGALIRRIAPASFGVYLMHVIFLDIFQLYTSGLGLQHLGVVIALEVAVVYAICVPITLLVLKVRYLRGLIGS